MAAPFYLSALLKTLPPQSTPGAMLSFFGGKPKSPVASSRPVSEVNGAAIGEVLGRAEGKLQQLQTSGGQDFPLLNEATRLGKRLLLVMCMVAMFARFRRSWCATEAILCAEQFNRWRAWSCGCQKRIP